jgi:hypothetical protein
MMANWSIENMERQQDSGLVTKVKWTVTLVRDMEFSNTNGVVELEASNSFVPFEELTKSQVLDWVWNAGVDKSAIEAQLEILVSEKLAKAQTNLIANGVPWQ